MKYFACIFALIAVLGMASAGFLHSGYSHSYSRPVVYSSYGHGGYGGYGGYRGYGGYGGYGGYRSYGHGGYRSGWW